LKKPMSVLLLSCMLSTVLLQACSAPESLEKPQAVSHRFVAAHRGYSQAAPENTLPAFNEAYLAGADAIEYDMQVTKDSHVVIMHDKTVNRTTNGKGKITDLTLAQVEKLDAGYWFSPRFKGTRVPTLAQLLDQFKRHAPVLQFSEIKHYRTAADIPLMIDPILKLGLEKRTVVTAFSPSDLHIVRQMSPLIGIGYLCPSVRATVLALNLAAKDPNTWVMPASTVLVNHPDLIRRASKQHTHLAAWTVNREDLEDDLELLGVHSFITNDPKLIEGSP
jgi:glycerophosphoryl diester phosphodiesterase